MMRVLARMRLGLDPMTFVAAGGCADCMLKRNGSVGRMWVPPLPVGELVIG